MSNISVNAYTYPVIRDINFASQTCLYAFPYIIRKRNLVYAITKGIKLRMAKATTRCA